MLPAHRAHMPTAAALIEAGQSILEYLHLCRSSVGAPLAPAMAQQMLELGLRHLRYCRVAGIPFGPKHHLFVHLMFNSQWAGSPSSYHTFFDEGLNKKIAAVARAAYATVWELRFCLTLFLSTPSWLDCW